jgi:vacuolar-type H+-ATPase catalytic subunit A/Vma1
VIAMAKTIEQITEDLSYSMASPEVPEFMQLIADQQWDRLKKKLKKHIKDEGDLNALVDHHKAEALTNFDLVELSGADLDAAVLAHAKWARENPDDRMDMSFVIRMGKDVIAAPMVLWGRSPQFALPGGRQLDPKKAHQVWRSVPRMKAAT